MTFIMPSIDDVSSLTLLRKSVKAMVDIDQKAKRYTHLDFVGESPVFLRGGERYSSNMKEVTDRIRTGIKEWEIREMRRRNLQQQHEQEQAILLALRGILSEKRESDRKEKENVLDDMIKQTVNSVITV